MRKSKYLSSAFAVLLVISVACDEFVTTQKVTPMMEFDQQSVSADGVSIVKIDIEFDRVLSSTQSLILNTSDGLLFELPNTDLVLEGDTELEVIPNSKSFTAYLKSGLKANDNVLVTARVNNLVTTRSIVFETNEPDDLFSSVSKDSLMIGPTDEIDLQIVLRSNLGLPSIGQKVEVSAMFDDIDIGGTIHSFNDIVIFDETLIANNDTLTAKLKSKILTFPDPQITEVNATFSITQGSRSSTERIRIVH